MHVVKRNRRLWIEDDAGRQIYTPPDFIRLDTRLQLADLAKASEAGGGIRSIMKFESGARRQDNKKPR